MLRRLSVSNYILIDSLEIEFDPRLNIITGETGAGKSILLGALGLCRKAGKLLHGYDRVQENALRGKVALVLLTSDASERTVSHIKDACDGIVACEQMPLTSADLAMLTPKPAAVFGVTDEHLAQLCAKYL